jgi:hypothetical protein
MSNFEKVELAYAQLKDPIDKLLKKETTDEKEIIKQNSKMLKYFTQLNKIVSILSDNAKIPQIKKKQKNNGLNEIKVNEKIEDEIEANNKKIFNNYKFENDKMEKLLKKLRDPEYSIKLVNERNKIKEDIIEYEKKIKDLKIKLKLGDIKLNRRSKDPSYKEIELKRMTYDYNSKTNEYNSLMNKMEKIKRS